MNAPTLARLGLTAAVVALGGSLVPGITTSSAARDEPLVRPTPQVRCNAGSRPETSIQGRVPQRDYDTGRAARGYTCNTRQVGHQGASGGFKTHYFRDRAGHQCVFYDSTRMAPTDVPYNISRGGLGTFVVAVGDARHPRQTATLQQAADWSPHESLYLNRRRGLLVAVAGNALTLPGMISVYSVNPDCRSPRLRASLPFQGFGHESGFAPDGRTFYASGTFSSLGQGAPVLTAIDLADPSRPTEIATYGGQVYHGLRLSQDGRTMYVANIGQPMPGARVATGGLRILDVSDIQLRRPDPQLRVVSDLSYRQMSIPQHADPVRIDGHEYVLENDEFSNFTFGPELAISAGYQEDAPVGAARLINVDDRRNPFVVSNLRLAVHQLANRSGPQQGDPGARSPIGGYTSHYCSAPRYRDPGIVACSMIGSGLRIFDVRDPYRPREVGYFNRPTMPGTKPSAPDGGASAMSAPSYDLKRRLVFYTDSYRGLFVVRLAKRIVPRHYWD